MSRKPIFAANWKMNKGASETEDFVKSFLSKTQGLNLPADIVIAPARMPPAAPGGNSNSRDRNTAPASPMTEQMTARNANRRPSPLRLLMNEGPTRRPTPYMNR